MHGKLLKLYARRRGGDETKLDWVDDLRQFNRISLMTTCPNATKYMLKMKQLKHFVASTEGAAILLGSLTIVLAVLLGISFIF